MVQSWQAVDCTHSLSDTQTAVREPIKVPASVLVQESWPGSDVSIGLSRCISVKHQHLPHGQGLLTSLQTS